MVRGGQMHYIQCRYDLFSLELSYWDCHVPKVFPQASHWMGTKQDRVDFPCLAIDISNVYSCISKLHGVLKGSTQPQSIPPQVICGCTRKILGGLGGLISSAGEGMRFSAKLLCMHVHTSRRAGKTL